MQKINEKNASGRTPLNIVSEYNFSILISYISFEFYSPAITFFYFLKFQAVINNSHESAKTLMAANAIIDENTKESCQREGDTETKTLISNEILKRVSKRISCL